MRRNSSIPGIGLCLLIAAFYLLVPWGPANAQSTVVRYGCYKAPAGTWYLIRLPGLPNQCRLGDHLFVFPTGTVSQLDTGYGLSGGPVTTTGTIALNTATTDTRYAQLNAANTFNGNQTVNGTFSIVVTPNPSHPPLTSFGVTSNVGGDIVYLKSDTALGQVLHTSCTMPGTDCYGIWADGTHIGGLFQAKDYGVTANAAIAGNFQGNVDVVGTLTKSAGAFKIDHPLDPANKYLSHSFVESPDMMNIYNGIVAMDGHGEAWVTLPEWFEALNSDFRYQLTAVGKPSLNLYIATEISGNRFKIGGGKPAAKVSWQVTGIRHDAYAEAHRLQVEEAKPPEDRGFYLHPSLFKQADEKSIFLRHTPKQGHVLAQEAGKN